MSHILDWTGGAGGGERLASDLPSKKRTNLVCRDSRMQEAHPPLLHPLPYTETKQRGSSMAVVLFFLYFYFTVQQA